MNECPYGAAAIAWSESPTAAFSFLASSVTLSDMDYQVELDTFRGPLDLLLFLVKRNEVDICDIPIAKVAEQFLDYINVLKMIDVEWAGEFLVMAATLMEIKSRLLLPRSEEEAGEENDPRLALVKQLLEYKKFKDAASALEAQAEKQLSRMARLPLEIPAPPDPAQQPLQHVELWDLVSAFGRLMRETAALAPRQIVMDETPIHVHMERIYALVQNRGRVPFAEVFVPPHTRGRLLGMFLATLELIKGRKIHAEQPEIFGEIWLKLAPPSPEAAVSPSLTEVPTVDVTTQTE
jgi:segregation and condensation protein A